MANGINTTEFGLAGAWLTALAAGFIPTEALWPSVIVVTLYTASRALVKCADKLLPS